MTFTPQLRIPGPTPLPEPVVRAQSQPMIDHRGPEFAALLREVTEGAKRVFGTSGDLLVLTCSGTGGMESAVANLTAGHDADTRFTALGRLMTRVYGYDLDRIAWVPSGHK